MPLENSSESVFHSLNCAIRGLKLALTPGLRRYVVAPILLNLVLFGAAFWLSGYYFEAFLEWLIPGWLDWLRWLLWPVFGVSFILFFLFSFSLIANILGSFFYGRLARTVESLIQDGQLQGDQDVGRATRGAGLVSEFARLFYFLSRALPILLLFVIPGVNLFAPFLWLAFSAWFLGMEYMAYPLEEAGLTFPDQRRVMKPYRVHVAAFGGLALMGLAIPVLNLLVPPAAVIGATYYVQDKKQNLRANPRRAR